MFIEIMHRPDPKLPTLITFTAACLICIAFVFVNITVSAQSQGTGPGDAVSISREMFSWIVAAAGCITLLVGIVYGFLKKQKYENLRTERDEWKSLAETREERIKELKYTASEAEARLNLKIVEKERSIVNLAESNAALVSQSLQAKAILRRLRLEGAWQGHEDRIHETQ